MLKEEDALLLYLRHGHVAEHGVECVRVKSVVESDLLEQVNDFVDFIDVPTRANVVVWPQIDVLCLIVLTEETE